MRDKNRIKPLIEKLQECWEVSGRETFYKLLFNLYHDIDDKWTDYYKEDDYWEDSMNSYIESGLELNNIKSLGETQQEILVCVMQLWEKYYDLRFPQLCNLIYSMIDENISDNNALQILKDRLGV